MADNENTLTSAEFSQQTGIAVSTITQMLRQGELCGEKRNGKWAIFASELQSQVITIKKERAKPSPPGPGPIFEVPAVSASSYDVESFARLTYLTEHGVRQWLKTGRLAGRMEAGGKALVEAANLDRPEFQHLVRK